MLDVTCCVRLKPCCMLLDAVACCCAKFETGQTFQPTTSHISFVPWSPKRSATMLDPFAQLFQHVNSNSQQCWELLHPFARSLKPRANGRNIVGSCCVRLHVAKSLTGFKLCATTPNNMQQGVQTDVTCNIQQGWELVANNVASVCTGLKRSSYS